MMSVIFSSQSSFVYLSPVEIISACEIKCFNKNPYKKQIHELKKFLRKQPHVMFTDKYFNEKYMEEKNESLSF